MAVLLFDQVEYEEVKPGFLRKIIHTDTLMMVLIDIINGPWEAPDPFHSHVHEQTSYIAMGEIELYCEGEQMVCLKQGDMFAIPSGVKHTIRALSARVRIIDTFTPLREDFLT